MLSREATKRETFQLKGIDERGGGRMTWITLLYGSCTSLHLPRVGTGWKPQASSRAGQYALALENPPLPIVSDMARFRIRTNWTNCISATHEFTLDELADGATRDKLKWAMSDPERLRPGETRQAVTERAAATFAEPAQGLRDRDCDPQAVAHFVNLLVFCMFAEDVGLLPANMFTRMLERTRSDPDRFVEYASRLFGAMATGGDVGFEAVAWFNGGLFDDDAALPLHERAGIGRATTAHICQSAGYRPGVAYAASTICSKDAWPMTWLLWRVARIRRSET